MSFVYFCFAVTSNVVFANSFSANAGVFIHSSHRIFCQAWHRRGWPGIFPGSARCRSRTSFHRVRRGERWWCRRSCRRWDRLLWYWIHSWFCFCVVVVMSSGTNVDIETVPVLWGVTPMRLPVRPRCFRTFKLLASASHFRYASLPQYCAFFRLWSFKGIRNRLWTEFRRGFDPLLNFHPTSPHDHFPSPRSVHPGGALRRRYRL